MAQKDSNHRGAESEGGFIMSGGKVEKMKGWESLFPKKHIGKPAGYYTASEISKETGLSPTTVRLRLRQLVSEGKIEYVDCIIGGTRARVYKI